MASSSIFELDQTNYADVLCAYKNFHKYKKDFKSWAKDLFIDDSEMCRCVFEIVREKCLHELGVDSLPDKELLELLRLSKLVNTTKPEKDLDNQVILENTCSNTQKSIVETGCSGLNEKSIDINNICTHANKEYCKYLNVLLKPLIHTHRSHIIELVHYVYKESGINHMPFLFHECRTNQQCIEIHLLIAKNCKNTPFDLTEFKLALEKKQCVCEDCRADDLYEEGAKTRKTYTAFESLFDNNEPIIPLPFAESSDSDSFSDNFEDLAGLCDKSLVFSTNAGEHLQAAKEKLLQVNYKQETKLLEKKQDYTNFINFMHLKLDRDVLKAFLEYHKQFDSVEGYNFSKAGKLPFFFYQKSNPLLYLNAVHHRVIDTYKLRDLKQKMPYELNCYVLASALNSFTHFFRFIYSIVDSDYYLIAMNLKYFVEKYRSVALFQVFAELASVKQPAVAKEVRGILLADIDLYLNVFYNRKVLEEPPAVQGIELNEEFKCTVNNTANWKDGSSIPPSLEELSVDEVFEAFQHPAKIEELDEKIAQYVLFLYYKKYKIEECDRIDFINEFLVEAAKDERNKIAVLENIESIKQYLTQENADGEEEGAVELVDLKKETSKDDLSVKLAENIIKEISNDNSHIKNEENPKKEISKNDSDINKNECNSDEKTSTTEFHADEQSNQIKFTSDVLNLLQESSLFTKKISGAKTYEIILQLLHQFPVREWRYRKAFIKKAHCLKELGVSQAWIKERFSNDKVFYIRNMVKEMYESG